MSVSIRPLPRTFPEFKQLRAVKDNYRTLRLHALKTAAESFSSRYEAEVDFPDQKWYDRLQNPMSTTFIAVMSSKFDLEGERPDTENWIGMVVVRGPFLPAEVATDLEVEETVIAGDKEPESMRVFVLNSFFVHENYRRRKIGVELLRVAEKFADEEMKEMDGDYTGVLCLTSNPKNETALKLYMGMGFKIVGAAVVESAECYLQKSLL
ncbi:uncharacterized protein V1513DRAFT_454381 [Lipomyces chichibuensis]|uniref:uncharacterized protein n=1 Tax=Lipomyces chichibuensis TaxID=1546026 RepID=UPI00334372E9